MADLYGARQRSTPARLSPGMSYTSLINAINQNFAAVDNQIGKNVVINDGDNPRIIFGELPDGTYGMVISKEGTDVLTVFD